MQVHIEKMVYGGAGLARTDQGIIFVPRAAPGDVLEVEVFERKKDYSSARITRILEPSAYRQTPECPNYETAGCCHWQHIRYESQLEIKEAVLRETLQRTGKIAWDRPISVIHGPERNYRLRASFHVRNRKLGFLRERGNTVVPIQECSALVPELNAFIPEANKILEKFENNVEEVRAVSGPEVAASFDGRSTGMQNPRLKVQEITFELHPEAFFQSNRYLLSDFTSEVLNQIGSDPQYVLDLFCGSGFFSIPVAKRSVEVLAVESNRIAVRQGRLNANLNHVENIQFVERDVDSALKDARIKPNVVLLNPPRTGSGKQTVEQVARLRAPRIVYVSCNPTTFGREAAVLLNQGYKLDRITMIDQFPNTYHIETVASFQLS
jgi:23S rRNA (uracil1939-C5)-methyltransferase